MGKSTVINLDYLDPVLILGPERYDPRRHKTDGISNISNVARIVQEQIYPDKGRNHVRYLVFDTSDAHEGIIMTSKTPIHIKDVGSAKKIIEPGDVIISRLRPYLRQVAYVDDKLTASWPDEVVLACSTEFFVLRSRDTRSIAFLAPYLLSSSVQEILSASQEGGHHPRFNKKTLETLSLPENLLSHRDDISSLFETAVRSMREADLTMRGLISNCAETANKVDMSA